jgi:hypothetical protein
MPTVSIAARHRPTRRDRAKVQANTPSCPECGWHVQPGVNRCGACHAILPRWARLG